MKSLNLDIEDIKHRYNILKQSGRDIAKDYGCGSTPIYRYMNKHNIPKVSCSEIFKRLGRKESFQINSVKKLAVEIQKDICSEYLQYGVNAASLGREHNVSATAIHKILKKYSIPTKNRKEILGDAYNGEGNPNWNPNRAEVKTFFHEALRQLPVYKDWRASVFKRDEYMCIVCGAKGYMEAHHIITLKALLEEYNIKNIKQAVTCLALWNVGNGITLCRTCHDKTKWHEPEYEQVFKEAINYE